MKRGDRVRVTFTGRLESDPVVLSTGGTLLRVRVNGMKGWVAIVPPEKTKVIEEYVPAPPGE